MILLIRYNQVKNATQARSRHSILKQHKATHTHLDLECTIPDLVCRAVEVAALRDVDVKPQVPANVIRNAPSSPRLHSRELLWPALQASSREIQTH